MSHTDRNQVNNLDSKNWHELVSNKRQLLKNLREATDKIIDIEKNGIHRMNEMIQQEKNIVFDKSRKLDEIRTEIAKLNSQLMAISENIVKSKNFVITMQLRIPSENEADLRKSFEFNQNLVTNRQYKNERNKNEAISLMNDAFMKLEAIKALRIVNEQLEDLNFQAKGIDQRLNMLDTEKRSLQSDYDNSQHKLHKFYDDRRAISGEHQFWLDKYDKYLVSLDDVNSHLDQMSQKRRLDHEYHYSPSAGALLKVKESAKRKFESGDKLSFEELKLLYGDD